MNPLLSSQDTGEDWGSCAKGLGHRIWLPGSYPFLCLFPFWDIRSEYFRNFVDSCLQKIPQDRPTSEVLLKVSTFSVLELVTGGATENSYL